MRLDFSRKAGCFHNLQIWLNLFGTDLRCLGSFVLRVLVVLLMPANLADCFPKFQGSHSCSRNAELLTIQRVSTIDLRRFGPALPLLGAEQVMRVPYGQEAILR